MEKPESFDEKKIEKVLRKKLKKNFLHPKSKKLEQKLLHPKFKTKRKKKPLLGRLGAADSGERPDRSPPPTMAKPGERSAAPRAELTLGRPPHAASAQPRRSTPLRPKLLRRELVQGRSLPLLRPGSSLPLQPRRAKREREVIEKREAGGKKREACGRSVNGP